jgi:hypothetical protein
MWSIKVKTESISDNDAPVIVRTLSLLSTHACEYGKAACTGVLEKSIRRKKQDVRCKG